MLLTTLEYISLLIWMRWGCWWLQGNQGCSLPKVERGALYRLYMFCGLAVQMRDTIGSIGRWQLQGVFACTTTDHHLMCHRSCRNDYSQWQKVWHWLRPPHPPLRRISFYGQHWTLWVGPKGKCHITIQLTPMMLLLIFFHLMRVGKWPIATSQCAPLEQYSCFRFSS